MEYQAPRNGFRTFVILWATQSVSVFGSNLTFFALGIHLAQVLFPAAQQKAQLAFSLSALALCRMLPTLLGTPLAGAWADRHDRRKTMIAGNVANGVLTLVVVGLVAVKSLQLWTLMALTVLMALADAFHAAAFDTSYAMLVSDDQLPRANGMMQSMWALSGLLAPAAAAAIITLGGRGYGVALAIAVDAATFLVSAAVLVFLAIPSPGRDDLDISGGGPPAKSIWADIREGGTYILHRPPLIWLLTSFAMANFTAGPIGVLQPMVVKFNLAADWGARGLSFETALATLGTAAGLGGIAAGLALSAWGGLKRRRVYGVLFPMIMAGALQVVFGLSRQLYLSAIVSFAMYGMYPLLNGHSQAIWQTQTPRELQGRVFSVRRVIAQFTGPISTALAGFMGGAFNPGTALAVMGGLLALYCIAQLLNPQLLRVEDKEYLDRMAAAKAVRGVANW